jgi:DNA modification methylase
MNEIFLGDGIKGMSQLCPGSVDLVLTDLPSGSTRAPFDTQVDLGAFFDALWRCLSPTGIAIMMASDLRYAAKVSAFPHYRYDLVWEKGRATGFFAAKQRPLRCHEFVLVFYRAAGTFVPQMTSGHAPINANKRQGSHGANYGGQGKAVRSRAGATTRYPRSVIATGTVGTTCPTRTHPQQKPQSLLCWLVRSYTRPHDLVVDPFAGSGSTGVACATLDRQFLGWEIDPTVHATATYYYDCVRRGDL